MATHPVFEMSSARAKRPWKQMILEDVVFVYHQQGGISSTKLTYLEYLLALLKMIFLFPQVGYDSSRDGIFFGDLLVGGRHWTTTAYHFCYFFLLGKHQRLPLMNHQFGHWPFQRSWFLGPAWSKNQALRMHVDVYIYICRYRYVVIVNLRHIISMNLWLSYLMCPVHEKYECLSACVCVYAHRVFEFYPLHYIHSENKIIPNKNPCIQGIMRIYSPAHWPPKQEKL